MNKLKLFKSQTQKGFKQFIAKKGKDAWKNLQLIGKCLKQMEKLNILKTKSNEKKQVKLDLKIDKLEEKVIKLGQNVNLTINQSEKDYGSKKSTIVFKSDLKKVIVRTARGKILNETIANSNNLKLEVSVGQFISTSPFIEVELIPMNVMAFQSIYRTKKKSQTETVALGTANILELNIIAGNPSRAQTIKINEQIDYLIEEIAIASMTDGNAAEYHKVKFSKTEENSSIHYIFKGKMDSFSGDCKLMVLPKNGSVYKTVKTFKRKTVYDNIEVSLTYIGEELGAFRKVKADYQPKERSEFGEKYQSLFNGISRIKAEVKSYSDSEKEKIEEIGLAYIQAYNRFEQAIKESQQTQEAINAFWNNVSSVLITGALMSAISTWVDSFEKIGKLTVEQTTVVKAGFNIKEDTGQVIFDKYLTAPDPSNIKLGNPTLPDEFKTELDVKFIKTMNKASDMTSIAFNVIDNYLKDAIRGYYMEHPEKFDADKEFDTYKTYVNFYNNFSQEMSVLVENKIPEFVFDDLQDAFENIMWANWIPRNLKITTVSSGGSGSYNSGTSKTYTSYETGLGKSTSGIIAALKRLGVLAELGLEMTDSMFEEWESEVIQLVKWGESYTPKNLF